MAYDETLASRIQELLVGQPGLEAKKMFGGVGYLVQGNMACGVHKNLLIVRVGPDAFDESMKDPHTRPFDMTGRVMTGWVMVEPAGFSSEDDLKAWIQTGLEYALTLPTK